MPQQEKSGHGESVGEIVRVRLACGITKKGRKAQELVPPGLARPARDGTSAARRHIGELGGRTGRRATGKIKAEAELAQQHQLEANKFRARPACAGEQREHVLERIMNVRMRIALGQYAAERAQ